VAEAQTAISKPKAKNERIAFAPVVGCSRDALAAPPTICSGFTIDHISGIMGYADHPRKRPERGLRGRSHAGLSAWSAGRLVDRDLQRHPSAPYPPESRKAERYATDPDYRLSLVKPKVWESRRL
jgi:hypothetical protein